MSEEEKRTLDFTKEYLKDNTGKYKFTNEDLIVLVNLIKKQQKQIEELKNINKKLNCENQKLFGETVEQQKEILTLKENNKILETLLQGNLYEMYKYYRELASSYQANSVSKDKIKAKIKEWDVNIKWANADDHYYAIKILKELLGEE